MATLFELVKRNLKLYFKDKGLFFSSLISPLILLVLYASFLAKVYKDSFVSNIPAEFEISETIINSVVASQLISSLLAVSCITIAFCSNLIMITDKANVCRRRLRTVRNSSSRATGVMTSVQSTSVSS